MAAKKNVKRFVRWAIPKPETWVDIDDEPIERPKKDEDDDFEKGWLHYFGAETWWSEEYGAVMMTVFAFIERVPDGKMVKIPADQIVFPDR